MTLDNMLSEGAQRCLKSWFLQAVHGDAVNRPKELFNWSRYLMLSLTNED